MGGVADLKVVFRTTEIAGRYGTMRGRKGVNASGGRLGASGIKENNLLGGGLSSALVGLKTDGKQKKEISIRV